jgi:Flp pilus assembly protein TadG
MRRHLSSATRDEHDERGVIAIMMAVSFLPLALMLALVADAGRVWVARERLQNSVEAVAVASATEWARGGSACSSLALEYFTADGSDPVGNSCSTTGSRTAGIVTATAGEDVDLMFSDIVGRTNSHVSASTRVRVSAASAVRGLWPFGLCADNTAIAAWISAGFPEGRQATITFQQPSQLCGGDVSGNWAVLDFNGGSVSNSETQQWATTGYMSTITVGDVINGSPGAPSTSLDMSPTIGKTILFPLYRYPRNNGSNARYTIVGFATARVDAFRLTGGAGQRSITITFKTGTTAAGATNTGMGGGNFGLVTWSVCSFDEYGVCQ